MSTEPFEEWARRRSAWFVALLLENLHGKETAKRWLWELTPFPAAVPRWKECAQGFLAALLPGNLHSRFMIEQMRTADRKMDRALKGVRRLVHEEDFAA